jgi:hypothetical protein
MYELTQDKLLIDVDKSLFTLIISIVNMNENEEATTAATELSDILLSNKQSTKNKRTSDSPLPAVNNSVCFKDATELDLDDNDDYVYKKINSKCKALFHKLNPFTASGFTSTLSPQVEFNFNSQLLSLDCLLNLNKHTKNLLLNESYKSQLRELKILDKIVTRLELIVNTLMSPFSGHTLANYLLEKFISCFNLLQTVTQTTAAASTCNTPPDFALNQLYLIDLNQKSLVTLIKQ